MKLIHLNTDFDYSFLTNISGVKFTNRQIDVAACLIGRQKYKDIGKMLSISPSTVDEHLTKIRSIIRNSNICKSKEILAFFESSIVYNHLRIHYARLLVQHEFEETLYTIKTHVDPSKRYLLKYHESIDKHNFLNKKLREHLGLVGIEFSKNNQNKESNIIYIIPNDINIDENQNNSIIYITQNIELYMEPPNKETIPKISSSYYNGFFKLLSTIDKKLAIKKLDKDFRNKKSILENNLINHSFVNKLSSTNYSSKTYDKLTEWFKSCIKHKLMCGVIFGAILGTMLSSITIPTLVKRESIVSSGETNTTAAFNLPQQLSYYTPRFDLTNAIWNKLKGNNNQETVVLAGLYGLGGIGKTTLASHVIHNPKQNYEFRGWFSAETKELLEAAYFELGEKESLFAKEMSDKVKISKVKDWLNSKKKTLLIYDNAPNIEILTNYLPNNGHIIVTSRNQKLPGAIEVGVMTETESLKLLNKLIPQNLQQIKDYSQQCKFLINKLGYLPLAISQAGAYIAENMLNIADYLTLYEEKKDNLLQEKTLPPGDRHEPIYITWDMNAKAIKQLCFGDKALELLDFIAYCYPENMPKKLLIQYLYNKTNGGAEIEFNKVLSLLKQYSLVNVSSDVVSIHRLVHSWIKHKHAKEKTLQILQKGATAIKAIYPWYNRTVRSIEVIKSLMPHAEFILLQIQPLTIGIEAIDLMLVLGDSYGSLGIYDKSKQFFGSALTNSKKHFGDNHLKTGEALHSLGRIYLCLGGYGKSKKLLEKSLIIKNKYYRFDHIEIAQTLYQLSIAHQHLGNYKKSKQLLEKTLSIKNKYYGANHVETAHVLHQLGKVYLRLGNYEKSKQLLETTLSIKNKYYGTNHVETAYSLYQLGRVYTLLGNYEKSKELFEKDLSIKNKYYDINHVEASYSLHQLGRINYHLGNYTEAAQLLGKALNIKERHFGINHVETAYTMRYLGVVNLNLGNYTIAKELLEQSLAIKEKYYGVGHMDTSLAMHQLGRVYLHLNDFVKARKTLECTLAIKEKEFGSNHIETAHTLHQLGRAQHYVGNYIKAKELLKKSLAIKEKHYSVDHVEVAYTLHSLSLVYLNLCQYVKANKLLEKTLRIKEQHFGANHIETAYTLNMLGIIHFYLGDYSMAKKLIGKALDIALKLNGGNDVFTTIISANLGNIYRVTSDASKSKQLLEKSLVLLQKLFSSNNVTIAKVIGNLGLLYGDLGNEERKKEYLEKALIIFQKQLLPEHEDIKKVLSELKNINNELTKSNGNKLGFFIMLPA